MNEIHDDDLRDAFAALRAPRSTADYARRAPTHEVATSAAAARPRWIPALAGVAAVVLAVGGAVTFLGLRSARLGSTGTASTALPPARSGAAMAYDSSARLTVMYGGSGPSGQALDDTWTWDGRGWTRLLGAEPPPLDDVQVTDDPGDGGVLMVGEPHVLAGACGWGSGSAGGSGVASPAGVATSPAAAPVPAIVTGPPIPCLGRQPLLRQTWVFNGHGWRQVAIAGTPPAGAVLATVPSSGQVLAVSGELVPDCPDAVSCPIAVPLPAPGSTTGSSSSPGAATGVAIAPLPCGVVSKESIPGDCVNPRAVITTWTWKAGQWTHAPADIMGRGSIPELVPSAAGESLDLFASNPIYFCTTIHSGPMGCPPPAAASSGVSAWQWSGAAWLAESSTAAPPPPDPGVLATSGSHALLLTDGGQTYVGPAGWTEVSGASGLGARRGEAIAADRNGRFVLFGGNAALILGADSTPGSDTWVFASGGWRYVSGDAPTPGSGSVVCPAVGGGTACAPPTAPPSSSACATTDVCRTFPSITVTPCPTIGAAGSCAGTVPPGVPLNTPPPGG